MEKKKKSYYSDVDGTSKKKKINTSKKNTIVLLDELITGNISLFLLDYNIRNQLPDIEYKIEGHELNFEGKSDKNGHIWHPDVISGFYSITVFDRTYSFPAVEADEEPYQLWVFPKEEENKEAKEDEDLDVYIPVDIEDEIPEDDIPENEEDITDETEETNIDNENLEDSDYGNTDEETGENSVQ